MYWKTVFYKSLTRESSTTISVIHNGGENSFLSTFFQSSFDLKTMPVILDVEGTGGASTSIHSSHCGKLEEHDTSVGHKAQSVVPFRRTLPTVLCKIRCRLLSNIEILFQLRFSRRRHFNSP